MQVSLRPLTLVLVATFAVAGCVREEEGIGDDNAQTLQVTAPAAVQTEATGPTTGVTLGQPTVTGGDGNYTMSNDAPASGFAVGATSVTWSVTDGSGNSGSATQNVTISDTTAPTLTRPADIQATSTGAMTMVTLGAASAVDIADPNPAVSNDAPAAGFPIGMTMVTWTATDASGNSVSDVQQVMIVDGGAGGNLTLTAPANVQAEATAPATMVALGMATAVGGTGQINIANDAPAGGFPVGATTVTWTATDAAMAQATATQTVTISDTTPPMITAPADVTADSTGAQTIVNLGQPATSDLADPAPTVSNDAPAGGFPVGATTVTWTAQDASGNAATATQLVTINQANQVLCSTLEPEFANTVYPILDTPGICAGCHTPPNSVSTTNGFNILANDTDGFNLFRTIAAIPASNNQSIMLVKALGGDFHGGGDRFPAQGANDPNYQAIESLVNQLANCIEDPPTSNATVMLGTGYEQLHKLTMALASRVPSATETAMVDGAADQQAVTLALDSIVDGLLNEDAFYTRVKEIYNDLLLTDKHADARDDVAGNFDVRDFANVDYFEDNFSGNERSDLRENANFGFARAPVELVAHVVRNDLPFTEILTADYTLVNPYSATIYGADVGDPNFRFDSDNNINNHDPNEFRVANVIQQQDGDIVPEAGVIGTHAFLDRYRSTNTNVNRARGRWFFYYFLGVDIEGLAPRDGLDLDNVIGEVPTFEDPQCTVCHDVLDPVAGLFKNRRNEGRFRVENNWYHLRTTNGVQRMLAPGYTADPADELPPGENATALAWLAQQAIADDRFASNTVRTIFQGLTRIDETAPETTAFITQLKDDFVAGGFNLKSLVKAVVLSDYFLARNLEPTANPANYRDFGTARLVTPEELHRSISAVVSAGYEWEGPNTNSSLMEQHRLLYGGIDSDDVTVRTVSPNSLMIGLQRRIARQVSCENTASDLINGGALFPIAGITDTPDGGAAEDRIRENIQFLHRHLLGEDLALTDAEIDATMQLFLDVRAENVTNIPSDCRGGGGSTDDNGTVIPWMAVVTYLLSDFGFVYH